MRFGVIADCQYADIEDWNPGEFDRRFRLSLKKLQEAIDFFNTQELEFIVHLGDLIDQGIENLEPLRKILDSSKHKINHVLGNHDFYVTVDADPRRNNHQALLDFMGMPAKYYSFTSGSFKFVVLDTNEVGTIEWEPDSEDYERGQRVLKTEQEKGYIYAKSWNGALSNEQLSWLQNEVKEADKNKQKVILFAHHQLFPENRENMLKKEVILELLDKNRNIVAFMNGHNHHGDYGVYKDVPCTTFKGMVEQESNAYAVAEIVGSKFKITGYGREISRDIELRD